MRHFLFGSDVSDLKVAILIKGKAMHQAKLERYYTTPSALPAENFIAFDLEYDDAKKCKAATYKRYTQEILPEIDKLGINTIMLCDAIYFKHMTGNSKAEPHYGYKCPCVLEGFEHLSIVLIPNLSISGNIS